MQGQQKILWICRVATLFFANLRPVATKVIVP